MLCGYFILQNVSQIDIYYTMSCCIYLHNMPIVLQQIVVAHGGSKPHIPVQIIFFSFHFVTNTSGYASVNIYLLGALYGVLFYQCVPCLHLYGHHLWWSFVWCPYFIAINIFIHIVTQMCACSIVLIAWHAIFKTIFFCAWLCHILTQQSKL